MSEIDVLMHAAAAVAREAGDVAMTFFRRDVAVETKRDGSPVTVADRGAELRAREWIEARFPGDAIIGEEFGETRAGARRRWYVDPIDGTKSFVRGVPLWGTLVAVVEGEDVLAGAAYCPAVGESIAAAPGLGCWWNEARCSVSSVATMGEATILTSDDRFAGKPARKRAWDTIAAQAAVSRTWGDCYGHLLVATGRAEVMVDNVVSPWDIAAMQVIVAEAGGVFTDWTGRLTAFGGSAIASNAALAQEVRAALREDA